MRHSTFVDDLCSLNACSCLQRNCTQTVQRGFEALRTGSKARLQNNVVGGAGPEGAHAR